MTTTATTDFNLDLNGIVEEAFERCGAELRTGYDLATARRSLNLLSLEWANRGINLWTIEQGLVALTASTGTYNLDDDTVDLLDHVIRTGSGASQTDVSISRISVTTYSSIPNKTATGRPVQVWINRRSGQVTPDSTPTPPQINIWPLPDSDDYTFVYWRMKRMSDMTSGLNNPEIPFRFLPALIAGLAYHLSLKVPNGLQRVELLKAQYEEQWLLAADEDREKAPLRIIPRMAP